MADGYDIQGQLDQYSSLMAPQYARSRASIANMMGGRGTLYGTPGMNNMQLLENQRLSDVGKYGQGLMQTQEQRAYDQPWKMASLLGTTPGSSGTYTPGQGWNWTGGPQTTLAGQATQQAGQTVGYAGDTARAAQQTAQAEQWKAIASLLSNLPDPVKLAFADMIKNLIGGATTPASTTAAPTAPYPTTA